MSTPTDTPLTDAALYPMNGVEIVWPDFARELEKELARLRAVVAEVEGQTSATLLEMQKTNARLRAELSAVQAQHLHEIDELAAQAKIMQSLRAEVKRLKKQIKDDNRAYGCELRDPNGTIWEQAAKDHARAEKAEAALAEAVDGEINGGSIFDKQLVIHIPRLPRGYSVGQPVKVILPAIDAAMKP